MDEFMVQSLPRIHALRQAVTASSTNLADKIAAAGVWRVCALERRPGWGIVWAMILSADIRSATAPVRPRPPRVAPHQPRVQPLTAPPALEPPWHVILLDDDYHTFDYVIEMLHAIFGHSRELGKRMASEVNDTGRVIVATVHKELAELRQQQIEEYGPDPAEHNPQGQVSMRALIECSE